jgi:hypothetical protein
MNLDLFAKLERVVRLFRGKVRRALFGESLLRSNQANPILAHPIAASRRRYLEFP